MLWALGYVDKLGAPTELCNVSQDVGYLQQKDSFGQFLSDATLRSKSELLDEADLIYRYNWVCVNSRIKGKLRLPGSIPV